MVNKVAQIIERSDTAFKGHLINGSASPPGIHGNSWENWFFDSMDSMLG